MIEELWIAEKPSLGRGIAAHLGRETGKGKSHIEIDGGRIVVAFLAGHIFEQAEPDSYTSDAVPRNDKTGKKVWRAEDLPIIPPKWRRKVTKRDLFENIRDFLKQTKSIVNAGDPDREGQLLVDEVLIEAGVDPDAQNVKRVWLAALDDDSVRKALSDLKPNRNYRNLRLAASARACADWLIGMNGTRAYTISARAAGGSLVTVGRVQTPTLAMVVARDRLIANFKPTDYFVPYVIMSDGTRLNWKARKDPHPGIDSEGRIVDRALADAILARIKAQCDWLVSRAEVDDKVKEPPPLPHSLDSLQVYLSKTHKMSLQQTLDACQSLYENHKAATYPRTDSRYLPESQYGEREKVFQGLVATHGKIVNGANPALKSRCFNDKKVTAHHAIVPTGQRPRGTLDRYEQAAYDAISKFYLAQFYPDARFRETNLEIQFDAQDTFVASTKDLLAPGWKAIFGAAEVEGNDPGIDVAAKAEMKASMKDGA